MVELISFIEQKKLIGVGVQQTMHWVPPAEFMMESPQVEPQRESDDPLNLLK